MTKIDELRKRLEIFYAQYDIYVLPALKFLLGLFVYLGINSILGYMEQLDNFFVVLVLALISAVLPLNGIVVFGFLLCTAHCFGLGLEVGACAAILYLLMALLYFRFVPGDALALVLTPAAFFLRVPAAVPLGLGMLRGPVSSLSAALGVVSWQFIDVVRRSVAPLYEGEGANALDIIESLGNGLLRDVRLWVLVLASAAAALIVSSVRKLDIDRAETISAAVGCAVYLVIILVGGMFAGAFAPVPVIVAGTAGAGVIAWFLAVFVYQPDYAGSSRLKFEDDEYYYFVRAVPKRGAARRQGIPRSTGGGLVSDGDFGETEELSAGAEKDGAGPEVDYGEKLEETLKDL